DHIEPRCRRIELAFFVEDPNSRKFKDPFLHQTVRANRNRILSAIASLYHYWACDGFPPGESVFTSFPSWSQTVGGVICVAGLGDPCRPWEGVYDTGGDLKTKAMTDLFRACNQEFGDEAWVSKKQIYECVDRKAHQDDTEKTDGDAE